MVNGISELIGWGWNFGVIGENIAPMMGWIIPLALLVVVALLLILGWELRRRRLRDPELATAEAALRDEAALEIAEQPPLPRPGPEAPEFDIAAFQADLAAMEVEEERKRQDDGAEEPQADGIDAVSV
ncbi:hypothetical protein, partial [Vannielia sp.]|uniref:hypothetical protein n=1 Tax=Vannielia sp. TaxID=2813045 RepID=UPI002612A3F7